MAKIEIQDNGENKSEKIWSIWGDSFGEVNAYMLTYDEALKMADDVNDDGEFDSLIIYVPVSFSGGDTCNSN